MLINKEGKIIANSSQVVKTFATPEEYEDWLATTDPADLNKFITIQTYLYRAGSYVEVEDFISLNNLPSENKQAGIIYGVRSLNKLYRFDIMVNDFVEFGSGS